MSADRKTEPPQGKSQVATQPARKAWVKKTPVDVVLEQINKQEQKVNDLREELKKQERELQKLLQAKKVLEAS
jgi:hypothetical protein